MADNVRVTMNFQAATQAENALNEADRLMQQQLLRANAAFTRDVERAIATVYGPTYVKLWEVQSSVSRGSAGGTVATITAFSDDKRMTFKEFGTKPHLIRARRAHALHFLMGEKAVFARSVHHPGTRARNGLPELADKMSQSFSYWETALGNVLDDVL